MNLFHKLRDSSDPAQHCYTMLSAGWLNPLWQPSIDVVDGTKCVDCLSDSEFPRTPAATATRRKEWDTGVFFWFVFFHGEENEQ